MAHPNICFAGTAFATPTPLFFSSGEAEALIEAITKAAQELRNIPGNKVEIHIQDNAPHDIILLGDAIGFEKETDIAVKAAQKFLESVQ
jgi:phenylpyruvate tautomerase PptA (4-oxalocrotonate tautomerase family)